MKEQLKKAIARIEQGNNITTKIGEYEVFTWDNNIIAQKSGDVKSLKKFTNTNQLEFFFNGIKGEPLC